MVSETLPTTTGSCLHFYTHLQGEGVGKLNVYRREAGHQSRDVLIWSVGGNQGNGWKEGQVRVSSETPYKVIPLKEDRTGKNSLRREK